MADATNDVKSIGDWLKSSLADEDDAARQKAVKNPDVARRAAVPELINCLQDEDWQIRNQAALTLGILGPEARAAVPALIGVLQETDKYFRAHAAR